MINRTHKTRTFDREWLQETICGGTEAEVIEDEIVDHSRWSVHHYLVFKFQDKFYGLGYSRGATEIQDEQPLEHEPARIDVDEVEPVKVVKREWMVIPNDE